MKALVFAFFTLALLCAPLFSLMGWPLEAIATEIMFLGGGALSLSLYHNNVSKRASDKAASGGIDWNRWNKKETPKKSMGDWLATYFIPCFALMVIALGLRGGLLLFVMWFIYMKWLRK